MTVSGALGLTVKRIVCGTFAIKTPADAAPCGQQRVSSFIE